MQEYPSLTRVGKRFKGNIEDTEQCREGHRAETLERTCEQPRKIPALLLENSTQTTSPPKLNTSAENSLVGYVQTNRPTQWNQAAV